MARKKSWKKVSTEKENPFNVKINRKKHSILGEKVKGTKGVPIVSNSYGNAKRKEAFYKKRLQSQKANKFVDKRLLNNSLDLEEQATARLVQERKKKLKKNIFNLNEEEELTHKGVPLLLNEYLDKTNAGSDDEGQLNEKFVAEAHFGGFNDSASGPKSRKEIIDDLILESKRRRAERQIEQEANLDLVKKLDAEWKDMRFNVAPLKATNLAEATEKKDSFDIALQELKFDSRGDPSSRVKTPEEIAREEYENQKKLEEERQKRMINPMETKQRMEELSADSIYDGIDIQEEPIESIENDHRDEDNIESSEEDESDADLSEASDDENGITVNVDNNDNADFISVSLENKLKIPESKEEFSSIISSHADKNISGVLNDIMNSYLSHKSKQNNAKMESFFAILIQYVMDVCDSKRNIIQSVTDIALYLHKIAEISPLNTTLKFLNLLDSEQELFQQNKGKKLKRWFPRLQTLIILKFSSLLYSVSDFKHPVVTPCLIFMCDILSSSYVISFMNIFCRLYITDIIYDCVLLSKRYVPEVVWFLNGLIKFSFCQNEKFNLYIEGDVSEDIAEINLKQCTNFNDDAKISIIFKIVDQLNKYSSLYMNLCSFHEIFNDTVSICEKLPIQKYPGSLKEALEKFIFTVKSSTPVYKPLVFKNRKPVPLKLFEPAFDSKFTSKWDDISKKRKMILNVNQKIRKEQKCLLREMRRDNQVIAATKLKEQLEADEERKRKVKQLYGELSMQEGEYKKYMKKK